MADISPEKVIVSAAAGSTTIGSPKPPKPSGLEGPSKVVDKSKLSPSSSSAVATSDDAVAPAAAASKSSIVLNEINELFPSITSKRGISSLFVNSITFNPLKIITTSSPLLSIKAIFTSSLFSRISRFASK